MSKPVRTVNIQEAKAHLSRLLRQVEAGEEIAIARAGQVIARLVRVEPEGARRLGLFDGQVKWTDDAFEPMDQDELNDWYESRLMP
jgi:prevent-host-death family protein